MTKKFTYRASGVDRAKADRLVEGIQKITGKNSAKALKKKLKSGVGAYASVFALTQDQWIAASTDGVGTKLKLAFETGKHDGIGQDLVAMSVNDLICVGAKPLFFLDYFATSRLNPSVGSKVIGGIADACAASGCLLVGGETAEMPGIYSEGEYDLAGFAVGSLAPQDMLPGKIKPGQSLIGLASTGFHSNGYSLIRQIIAEKSKELGWDRRELLHELLVPTALYPQLVRPVQKFLKGAAHITGSGFLNVPRMSDRVSYEITLPPLKERARIFSWLHELDVVSFAEAAQTFNLGLGMILAVDANDVRKVLAHFKKSRWPAWEVGRIVRSAKTCLVSVEAEEGEAVLEY